MNDSLTSQPAPLAIGTIVEIHGPVVIIDCNPLPPLRQALYSTIGENRYVFEVHQHLDERHIRAITLHGTAGLSRGLVVVVARTCASTGRGGKRRARSTSARRTARVAHAAAAAGCLGPGAHALHC